MINSEPSRYYSFNISTNNACEVKKMQIKKDSIAVVVNGDWNKLYIQPDWMARNVFEKEKIEIGINTLEQMSIICKSDNVIIKLSQSQVVFSTQSYDKVSLQYLAKCVSNFIVKSFTPIVLSFGLNIEFIDDQDTFLSYADSLWDYNGLIECGSEILTTNISRMIKLDDTIYNIDYKYQKNELIVHINEHHDVNINKADFPDFTEENIEQFVEKCWRIMTKIGYERDE